MTKRLFLFAAYDRDGIVDDALLYYLRALSELGDIIVVMDNDAAPAELRRITAIPNVIHATATRHGEYDFGSYKRAYQYARGARLLKKYDWLYLVNDSVFGPLFPLSGLLTRMEAEYQNNAFGMSGTTDSDIRRSYPFHIQSWFVGLSAATYRAPWFDAFMESITHLPTKDEIVWRYEIGLSRHLMGAGIRIGRVDPNASCTDIYARGYIQTLPFVKKLAIRNIPSLDELVRLMPSDLQAPFLAAVARHALHKNTHYWRAIWKLKLFSRITLASLEQSRDFSTTSRYRLTIFKIIRFTFIRY